MSKQSGNERVTLARGRAAAHHPDMFRRRVPGHGPGHHEGVRQVRPMRAAEEGHYTPQLGHGRQDHVRQRHAHEQGGVVYTETRVENAWSQRFKLKYNKLLST